MRDNFRCELPGCCFTKWDEIWLNSFTETIFGDDSAGIGVIGKDCGFM
jgi:hypothetical protein